MKNNFHLTVFLGFLLFYGQAFTASSLDLAVKSAELKGVKISRLNPFQPSELRKIINKDIAKKSQGRFSEIKNNSIRLLGIIKNESKSWALISCYKGILSYMQVGDNLSNSRGKIVEIRENNIRIEKKVFLAGQWLKKTKDIYLIGSH